MNARFPRFVSLGSLCLSTLLSCAGAQVRDPEAAVSLGDWCKLVSHKTCDRTAAACFNGMSAFADGCKQNATSNCLVGRDPAAPSGRKGAELNACLAKLDSLSCAQLGASMGSGEFASYCSAQAPAASPPPPASPPLSPPPSPTTPSEAPPPP